MGRLLELISEFPAIRPLLLGIQPSLSSLQSILLFFFDNISRPQSKQAVSHRFSSLVLLRCFHGNLRIALNNNQNVSSMTKYSSSTNHKTRYFVKYMIKLV